MKNTYTIIFLLIIPLFSYSQWQGADDKRDYNWVFGPAVSQGIWGRGVMTFQTNPASDYSANNFAPVEIARGGTSMSDWFGNLLFYSNYFRVMNQSHQIMENGDSLNCCTSYFTDYHISGTGLHQSIIALPKPNATNLYYLFHLQMEWGNILSLMYSVIDMNLGGGLGKVIQKNEILINDTLGWGGLTACRHANGRDWWILVREFNSNRFHRIYISPDGPIDLGIQTVGNSVPDLLGQAIFSPDGTKFAIVGSTLSPNTTHIYLYDFDRCNGFLSNPTLHNIPHKDVGNGACFSPNSQYLYYSASWYLYQISLQNFESTQIAVADSFFDSVTQTYLGFGAMQLAPDNKIYIATGNSHYLSVINSPDLSDTLCFLQQHGANLKTVNAASGMPTYPHYRLGREIGSACDTIYTTISPPQQGVSIQVYPNPAQESVTIELPQKAEAVFSLLDIRGRVVLSQKLRQQKEMISLGNLAKGMYFYRVENEKGIWANGKLVKE